MQDAFAYCETLVRQADQDRALATLFAAREHRPALYALYAFNIEIARVADAAKEPLAGEVRLQWWQEAIEGCRGDEARGNPVAAALLDTVRRYDLPPALLEQLVDGRRDDLAAGPVNSFDDLGSYCRKTSSTLMELAARVLDRDTRDCAFTGPAGVSLAMTDLLRAFPHSRRFLPVEVFIRHRVGDLDEDTPALRAALHSVRERAAGIYQQALPLIALAPRPLTAAWLPMAAVPLHLRALARNRQDVPALRRLWAMWRAARAGRPGKL